jgi:hypothetical protein
VTTPGRRLRGSLGMTGSEVVATGNRRGVGATNHCMHGRWAQPKMSPSCGAVTRQVRSAIALSHLGDLPSDVVDHLTANAVKIKLAAGSVSSREGEIARHLDLVVTGVVRVFVVAPDGRTMTVRYGPPGALIGAVSLFAAGYASPVTTQALVDAEP